MSYDPSSIDTASAVCPVCSRQYDAQTASRQCPHLRLDEPVAALPADPLIGQKFADLQVVELLGYGGTSKVYKVRQDNMRRFAAMKVLHFHLCDDESVHRFQNEAESAAKLVHPGIAQVYDLGLLPDGRPYMLLELLEGESLDELLKKCGRVMMVKAVRIITQACDALAFAHEQGIIHRDIKPSNIFLTNDQQVKILDFGLAKVRSASGESIGKMSKTGQTCGTPDYMSPEQCTGKRLSAASDIYSLGCVMYELMSGKKLIHADTFFEAMNQHVSVKPARFDEKLGISEEVEKVVLKTLEKQERNRYHSMVELKDALLKARSLAPGARSSATGSLNNGLVIKIAAGAALVTGIAAFAIGYKQSQPDYATTDSVAVPSTAGVSSMTPAASKGSNIAVAAADPAVHARTPAALAPVSTNPEDGTRPPVMLPPGIALIPNGNSMLPRTASGAPLPQLPDGPRDKIYRPIEMGAAEDAQKTDQGRAKAIEKYLSTHPKFDFFVQNEYRSVLASFDEKKMMETIDYILSQDTGNFFVLAVLSEWKIYRHTHDCEGIEMLKDVMIKYPQLRYLKAAIILNIGDTYVQLQQHQLAAHYFHELIDNHDEKILEYSNLAASHLAAQKSLAHPVNDVSKADADKLESQFLAKGMRTEMELQQGVILRDAHHLKAAAKVFASIAHYDDPDLVEYKKRACVKLAATYVQMGDNHAKNHQPKLAENFYRLVADDPSPAIAEFKNLANEKLQKLKAAVDVPSNMVPGQ